jgi:hypothetical protein
MSKDRKVRNFDFLKQTPTELPSREEVIQKTAELTGQKRVGEEDPSVSEPILAAPELPIVKIAEPVVPLIPTPNIVAEVVASIEKEKKSPIKKPKAIEPPHIVQAIIEKSKVGRRALVDTRKPFTTTLTVDNKRKLRQLCAEHDIAMSDVINEILSAHFEQRTPTF